MPDTATTTVPLLPLTNGVVLPGMVVTMALESPEAQAAVAAAEDAGERVLLVPRVGDRYATVGTLAAIEDRGELVSGVRAVVVRGLDRARIGSGVSGPGRAIWVEARVVAPAEPSDRARELSRRYRATVENVLERRGTPRMAELFRGIQDPGAMADTAGYSPDLSFDQKVELLETVDVEARLELACGWLDELLADLSLKERINDDVTQGMERAQREFLLRQQMAAIRRELGEDGGESAVDDYRSRFAELDLPEGAREAVDREIGRLERTSEQSPEHGWIRAWLDTVGEVPWGRRSTDDLDLGSARTTLDADHTGLDDVKERIVEHLAVRRRRADRGLDEAVGGRGSGAILALVGPPGVGKTSLGESVARALGRRFVRVALGGVRDEAEIRGHRRTYVGAQPGRIVRALREAGTMNPVFLLDEVDKLGADWRGDPSAALLEVLDPAQNHTFRDHYLEIDLDLSEVIFLATANVAEAIPGPLLDRLEVITLEGYTTEEKVAIARDHLLVRQRARNALDPDEVVVHDDALRAIVEGYTREAGVRQLERQVGKLLRKVATRLVTGAEDAGAGDTGPEGPGPEPSLPVVVGAGDVTGYLGRRRHFPEAAERTAVPGVVTGLAVTGAGGEILFVEAARVPGEPGLTVTGQLGDVMKESAEIALSHVRGRAADLGIDRAEAASGRFHLHVPAGAVPKDGPSAGVTMVTALASLLTGRPARAEVGMTGEVTLQGRVLPIGGVKQKVLAAHQAGITEVILPARNEADLTDVPSSVAEALTFHLVSEVGEVLDLALEPAPAAPAAA